MLLDVIPLSDVATRHTKHVLNTGTVNHINSIWPYFYAIIWRHTISIFLTQYNTIWHRSGYVGIPQHPPDWELVIAREQLSQYIRGAASKMLPSCLIVVEPPLCNRGDRRS